MKIRTKFTLLQLFIVTGFLGSMAFISIRFPQAYHLKQLELQSVELSDGVDGFLKRENLSFRRQTDDAQPSVERLDDDLPARRSLYTSRCSTIRTTGFWGKTAVMRAQARLEAWGGNKSIGNKASDGIIRIPS